MDPFSILWSIFGIREVSLDALRDAIDFASEYISISEFEETIEDVLDEYVKSRLASEEETVQSIFAGLPRTKEGWLTWYIERTASIYSADYGGSNGDELIYLGIEREDWDMLNPGDRDLIMAYFRELVGDINSLVIIDEVYRGNHTYVYHNGKLHVVL